MDISSPAARAADRLDAALHQMRYALTQLKDDPRYGKRDALNLCQYRIEDLIFAARLIVTDLNTLSETSE